MNASLEPASGALPRLSLGLPQLLGEEGPALITRYARRAEELGFAGLWTLDSAVGGSTSHAPLIDGLHALTFAAAATAQVRLGVAVIVLPRRNPLLLAKELASIDCLSSGRLTVGIGLGGAEDERTAGLGFPTGRRVRRLVEGVRAMRAVWSEQPASLHGETLDFSDLRVGPKPLQRPGPPIWFGAGRPPSLRRAARLGDGWIGAGSSSTEEFSRQLPILREALAGAGRDERDFAVAKRVYVAVDASAERASERMRGVLDSLYGAPGLSDRCALCGTAAQCAEELGRLAELGAQELVLHPMYGFMDQLESFAEVARLLRAL